MNEIEQLKTKIERELPTVEEAVDTVVYGSKSQINRQIGKEEALLWVLYKIENANAN